MGFGMGVVAVPATLLFVGKVPGGFQLGDDPLCGALGDTDTFSETTKPDSRYLYDGDEDTGVVGEKSLFFYLSRPSSAVPRGGDI